MVGISKQAVWEYFNRQQAELHMIDQLIRQINDRRRKHPGEGLEKLYWQINPEGMGRDKFCQIFQQLGYGLARLKNRMRTTIPAHKVFQNLIEGVAVARPHQVWQSDITYIRLGDRFYYLTFIVDVYTRQIVGYAVSDSLRAEANLRALKMAIAQVGPGNLNGLVHHSDRGSQYTDSEYLRLLRSHDIQISMGKKAVDNAFAERINGIIKNEYLIPRRLSSLAQLKYWCRQAVTDYNTQRHHRSLGKISPADFERRYWQLPAGEHKLQVIRSEQTPPGLEASLQTSGVNSTPQNLYCPYSFNQ